MADMTQLALLQKSVRSWNEWRINHPEVNPDLFGANLRLAELNSANLSRANLSGSILSGAGLISANLRGANLISAFLEETDLRDADILAGNFSGANLKGANFTGADLRRANFNQAFLVGVNLNSTPLAEANFTDSVMGGTALIGVDLSSARGLETVQHRSPSSISIDTVYHSKGKIPEQFLRGAGIPDNFIQYMGSLTGKAFEYYSCFISYSTEDQNFAERIYADLQANAVRCWFAPHDVQAGKKLHEQIDTAIRLHERLLLILSPDSINSEWVKTEISKARQREVKERKRVLFPVRVRISFEELRDWEYFDADIGKSSAHEIREYYIPDFTLWQSQSYREEFEKLLRDLKKADESQATPLKVMG